MGKNMGSAKLPSVLVPGKSSQIHKLTVVRLRLSYRSACLVFLPWR